MELTVAYGKQAEAISLPPDAATCAGLATELAARYGVAPATIKLLAPGVRAPLHLADRGGEALAAAGACAPAIDAAWEDGCMVPPPPSPGLLVRAPLDRLCLPALIHLLPRQASSRAPGSR